MLTRLTRPLRTALRWVRQSSTMKRLACRIAGHSLSWSYTGTGYDVVESDVCRRCGRKERA
jgi:hypothetical protein